MPVVPLFPNELAQVKDYSASSLSPRSLVAENESLNPAPRNPMFLLASFKSKLGSMQHLNLHQIIYSTYIGSRAGLGKSPYCRYYIATAKTIKMFLSPEPGQTTHFVLMFSR